MAMQDAERWVRQRLTWSRLYRIASYARSSLWVMPIFAVALEVAFHWLLRIVDPHVTWRLLDLGVSGAQALFQTVITLTLSFLVFTFGSLLVAVQVAGGQMTPRIIATLLLQDRVIKYTVTLNVFALMFAVSGLNRTEDVVHQLATLVGGLLGIASIASFLFLIDYAAKLLRPVSIVALVCDDGMDVVRAVYPKAAVVAQGDDSTPGAAAFGAPTRTMSWRGRSQIVLAVQLGTLVELARRADGVVEIVPQVGDFVATDEPLFNLYGGAAAIKDHVLETTVALGGERTMEQDPMFAFRILVDIALKALSPAINDPTTAVLAIDQIHRLLRYVGKRHLHDDFVRDASGRVRVVLRTPNWKDFVSISCREIRACGANNLQIARRMRAMLENLLRVLPADRHAALQEELQLLDKVLPGYYPLAEDLALARIPDSQGLGGAAAATRR